MIAKFQCPNPLLQPYIDGYIHIETDDQPNLIESPIDYFPIGSSFIGFILNNPNYIYNTANQTSIIRFNFSGQIDHYQNLQSDNLSMICVKFKPFGAYRVLGFPQHEFKNQIFDLPDLLGGETRSIQNQLDDFADQPEKVMEIIEKWLLYNFEKNRKLQTQKVEYICDQITSSKGILSIKNLNKSCLMSKSSMEQHFKDKIGLSPKVFSRIIRFRHLFQKLKIQKDIDWMESVSNFGYYDQSHFIHDFKYFFGYTPTQMDQSKFNISEAISTLN